MPRGSGNWKSKIQVSAGWFLPRATKSCSSLPGLQTAVFFLSPHHRPLMCVFKCQRPLFYKDTSHSGLMKGPRYVSMTPTNDICNNPIPQRGHGLRFQSLGLQHVNLRGHNLPYNRITSVVARSGPSWLSPASIPLSSAFSMFESSSQALRGDQMLQAYS